MAALGSTAKLHADGPGVAPHLYDEARWPRARQRGHREDASWSMRRAMPSLSYSRGQFAGGLGGGYGAQVSSKALSLAMGADVV